jgi:histone acetyltransferase MYST1
MEKDNSGELEREEESTRQRVEVGRTYTVRRRDGQVGQAEVIEIQADSRNGCKVYVHYENSDRRLDEWVEMSRIMVGCAGGPEDGEDGRGRKMTRNLRRKHNEESTVEINPATAELEKKFEAMTRVKFVNKVQVGRFEMETWYFSPYCSHFGKSPKLWICEFCLKYASLERSYQLHQEECGMRTPPGKEIYRKGNHSVFEVDGVACKLYCQNLCLLAKLFLDHKTRSFEVEHFNFYILCEVDRCGAPPL